MSERVYIRDKTIGWVVVPSEILRRAFVQAATAIGVEFRSDDSRKRRLKLLVEALGGELSEKGPESERR